MRPFAVVAVWDDRPLLAPDAGRLLDPIRHRCTDGTATIAVPGAAAAVGLRAILSDERPEQGLFVDRPRKRLLVGDVRLDDRTALCARLGIDGAVAGATDLSLFAEAIDRFGDDAPARVAGDLAVVLWDWGEGKVRAFRDRFGILPLHYRHLPGEIAFASDVRQLRVLAPEDRDIDPQMALDFLTGRYAHHGRTFFRHIRQVRPAHVLTVGRSGDSTEVRYWNPPQELSRVTHLEEALEEWRRLFALSVRDRVRSTYPVASYLSGGLDSGSIVGAAHDIYQESGIVRPPFYTLSAQFPGMPCDETAPIDAMASRAPSFPSIRWDATVPNSLDLEAPVEVAPRIRQGIGRGPRSEFPILREKGVRVVLSGSGGDELGRSDGIFRDLLLGGHPIRLLREMFAMGSLSRARHYLADSFTPPGPLPPKTDAPDWAGPELAAIFPGTPDEIVTGVHQFHSHMQRDIWLALNLPQAAVSTDVNVLALADVGTELRLPYRDSRLVEYVLTIPWQVRLPRGDIRRLQREAVAPYLPISRTGRPAKILFGPAIAGQIRANLPAVRALLDGGQWASAPYVSRWGARRLLKRLEVFDAQITNVREWIPLWNVAMFEAWLRAIPGL